MDDWEKSCETSFPKKEDFYSHLNMEDTIDEYYMHVKRVWKDFEIKNLGEYHDLYVQNYTLMLADVFENFRNICFEIYDFGLARYPSAPGLANQVAFKNTNIKILKYYY